VSVEGRAFTNTERGDPFHSFRQDAYFQVELARFF